MAVAVATTLTRKGETTRRSILDAAIVRFGRDGYRATSVADIARAAGVGGTVAYVYFPSKEALFDAAADEDAGAVIRTVIAHVFAPGAEAPWREAILPAAVAALRDHPLARRLLAGLEPDVTARIAETPALDELRRACADRLLADQAAGTVRADVDAVAIANGFVAIVLVALMAVVQLGPEVAVGFLPDVRAVFAAALDPPRPTS